MAKEKPSKPLAEKPDKQVTIEIPQGQFPVALYANVFGLESVDGHSLVHFGLMISPARLLSAWACVFERKLIASDEFYTTVQAIPADIEWDNRTEKRFQALAVKEATETLRAAEFVELEQLTKVRRKHTAPPVSANELLEELRQWQSVSRVFEALARYVEEIGLKRDAFTNGP